MDLLHNRKGWSVIGGAVGFGLLIAWMVPPTEPKPTGQDWRAQVKPIAPPAPVEFAGLAPPIAPLSTIPVEQSAYARNGANVAQNVTLHRGQTDDEDGAPVAGTPADANNTPDQAVTPQTADQADGNRAVERRTAVGSDICDAAPNSAVESRCRDYYAQRRGALAANNQPAAGEGESGEN